MTREEAVKRIKAIQKLYVFTPTINEALDLAIEALKREIEYGQMVVDFTKGETIKSDEWKHDTTCVAESATTTCKLKNPCDSLLTDDSEACKEQKSKLDCISRQQAVEEIGRWLGYLDEDMIARIRIGIRNLPPVTPTERTGWIPVSERLPKDLEEVVVTWVNRNPPVYYRHEKDKPQTGIAVLYRDTWHWWDSTIVDVLAEYGSRCEIEHISEDIEIIAWQPLPDPYKGGDTE